MVQNSSFFQADSSILHQLRTCRPTITEQLITEHLRLKHRVGARGHSLEGGETRTRAVLRVWKFSASVLRVWTIFNCCVAVFENFMNFTHTKLLCGNI